MGDFSIQISPELINRFANDGEKLKKKPRRTKPKLPLESAKAKEKKHHDGPEKSKGVSSPGWPVQPPMFLPVTPPGPSANGELEAIKSVIQDSERVLEKLQMQDDRMSKEVTERAKDLHDKEFKLPYQKPMPCLADYDACRACYKENANDILKCAPLTKTYYECVQRAKQQGSSADK